MKDRLFNPVVPRPDEQKEAALLARLRNRLQTGKNDLEYSLQISRDLERQPMIMQLYVERYVWTGEYNAAQLDEILQLLLLTWLFHEQYYNMIFQPLTIADFNRKLKEQEQWAETHVGNDKATDEYLRNYHPRVLLTNFVMMVGRPSEAMRFLPLQKRFNLQLTYMALTACFQAQRKK